MDFASEKSTTFLICMSIEYIALSLYSGAAIAVRECAPLIPIGNKIKQCTWAMRSDTKKNELRQIPAIYTEHGKFIWHGSQGYRNGVGDWKKVERSVQWRACAGVLELDWKKETNNIQELCTIFHFAKKETEFSSSIDIILEFEWKWVRAKERNV